MEKNSELLNSISVLSSAMDALMRSSLKDKAEIVAKKIIELVEKLE